MNDDAVEEIADMLGMTPLQIDELTTFYTFIFREPVGKYVIHICDSVVCWLLDGYIPIAAYLSKKLKIEVGETTPDGLFTLLPVCCIGYCDRAPAMMINKKVYGFLDAREDRRDSGRVVVGGGSLMRSFADRSAPAGSLPILSADRRAGAI